MKKEEIKKWKPGQLITLRNKVYRVKEAKDFQTCSNCAFANIKISEFPCNSICFSSKRKTRIYCYLKEI